MSTTKTVTKKSSKTTQSPTVTPANPSPTPPPANPSPSPATITTVASTSDPTTKLSQQASYSAVVAGLLANYQPTDTFLVESETYTRDEAVAELNRFITAAEETKTNYQAWLASVQNERQVLAEVAPVKVGIMSIVLARYGKTSPQLRQFGRTPQKPRKVNTATRSAAIAKGEATREARGTMSKKKRASIKAATAAPTATTSPEPAAATAPATPVAPAATSAAPAPAAK